MYLYALVFRLKPPLFSLKVKLEGYDDIVLL